MPFAPRPHPARARSLTALASLTALTTLVASLGLHSPAAQAMGLTVTPQTRTCSPVERSAQPLQPLPAAANMRLAESQAVTGRHDLAWAWLGSPTRRYPHGALGSPVHAGSVHALVKTRAGGWETVALVLPLNRVYEDRVPRIVDLDRDGREEMVLIEADTLRGAALVVLLTGGEINERGEARYLSFYGHSGP